MTRCLRIVVADDEPAMRVYFQKALPRLGHEVVGVAHNGRELVDLCHSLHPDLVITDIRMPEMDGIDAAALIHRERAVPIIMLSAYHDADRMQAGDAHLVSRISKPIKQADLKEAIALSFPRNGDE